MSAVIYPFPGTKGSYSEPNSIGTKSGASAVNPSSYITRKTIKLNKSSANSTANKTKLISGNKSGDGGGGEMETRINNLEKDTSQLRENIVDIKNTLNRIDGKIDSNLKWSIGISLSIVITIIGTSLTLYLATSGDVRTLNSNVNTISSDTKVLFTHMEYMKSDITLLKTDVQELKTDVHSMKSDVSSIKDSLKYLTKDK